MEAMELIAVRIPDDMKKKLEKIAQAEHRPLSNLIRLILIEWLEKREKKPTK
jgi:predicted transcriptional regulator